MKRACQIALPLAIALCACAARARDVPLCSVTFNENEPAVNAFLVRMPDNSMVLAASSKHWPDSGAHIEVAFMTPAASGRMPLTAYVRTLVGIQKFEGGGAKVEFPVTEIHGRLYTLDPEQELRIDTPAAIVKCKKGSCRSGARS